MTDLHQALEALTNCNSEHGHRCNRCDSEVDEGGKVASALRAALAEDDLQDLADADREIEAALEQPVRVADELPAAWQCAECGGTETLCPHGRRDVPLYAKPQPLTDAEIDALVAPWWNSAAIAEVLASNHPAARAAGASVLRHVARVIERAHGIGGEP